MLKTLIKKQFMEMFRSYFYNPKTNQKRSTAGVIAWFTFFAVLIVGVLGGTFTFMAIGLCGSFVAADAAWLYFLIMSGISILLGAFGSVFNTYSSLYLSKDNDLLLSMPIPIRDIVASRLLSVYFLGAMYSGVVLLPSIIVYWVFAGITFANVICNIALFLIVSVFVLLLSCLLGWVIAKISVKIKNRSFVVVLCSLAFLALYYIVYFKAQSIIEDLVANAQIYGDSIKGSAYVLYLFGRIGEGSFLSTGIFILGVGVLTFLTWLLLKKTFLSIATAAVSVPKAVYKEKKLQSKSMFKALLGKEFNRFTASPNYMLNCGLGIVLVPVASVVLLITGKDLFIQLDALSGISGFSAVVLAAGLAMLGAMIDIVAPSVSLEGKNIWILQSMPVDPKYVLRAKLSVQLILAIIPTVFATICGLFIIDASVYVKILMCIMAIVSMVFMGIFDSFLGIKMPMMTWTNELYPIKQSGCVAIALFSGWGLSLLIAGPYFFLAEYIGVVPYLAIWICVLIALSAVLFKWLDTKGAQKFSEL